MKLRRSTKRRIGYILIGLVIAAVLGGSVYFVTYNYTEKQFQWKLEEKKQMIDSHRRTGYVALSDLSSGEIIKEGVNVSHTEFYSSQEQATYLTEEELGNILCIDVPKGTQLMKTMIADQEEVSNLREVRFGEIVLSSNISAFDWCDVRIIYPNGENYCVISKKQVKQIQKEENQIFFWLSEEDIQHMSSAVVDCYLYSGSRLYLTKYITPGLQEASIPTYIPSEQTAELIRSNPNIVDIASSYLNKLLREELESRLTSDISESSIFINKIQGDDFETAMMDDVQDENAYFNTEERGNEWDE